jgi:hypothetical protein
VPAKAAAGNHRQPPAYLETVYRHAEKFVLFITNKNNNPPSLAEKVIKIHERCRPFPTCLAPYRSRAAGF